MLFSPVSQKPQSILQPSICQILTHKNKEPFKKEFLAALVQVIQAACQAFSNSGKIRTMQKSNTRLFAHGLDPTQGKYQRNTTLSNNIKTCTQYHSQYVVNLPKKGNSKTNCIPVWQSTQKSIRNIPPGFTTTHQAKKTTTKNLLRIFYNQLTDIFALFYEPCLPKEQFPGPCF